LRTIEQQFFCYDRIFPFEVDAESITVAVLYQLVKRGEIKADVAAKAIKELGVDPEKLNPVIS